MNRSSCVVTEALAQQVGHPCIKAGILHELCGAVCLGCLEQQFPVARHIIDASSSLLSGMLLMQACAHKRGGAACPTLQEHALRLQCLPGCGICMAGAGPVAWMPGRRVALPIMPVVHALWGEQILIPAIPPHCQPLPFMEPSAMAQRWRSMLQADKCSAASQACADRPAVQTLKHTCDSHTLSDSSASAALHGKGQMCRTQDPSHTAIREATHWRPSSREPEGMLWQCRMGDRKGGDIKPALLRLDPLLLQLLLPLW